MSNQIRTRDGQPFDFEDGLKVKGVLIGGDQGGEVIRFKVHPEDTSSVSLTQWVAATEAAISEIQTDGVGGGDASTTVKGKVQLATEEEAFAGADVPKAVTPKIMRAVIDAAFNANLTVPDSPSLTGSTSVIVGQTYTLNMSATVTQAGATISSFNVSINGGATIAVNATAGAAVYNWTSTGTVGSTVTFSVIAKDSNNKFSAASIKSITLSTVTITTPTISSPANAATNVSVIPTLTTAAFATSGGSDTHQSTDWIITTTGGTVVWQSIADTVNKVSIAVPANTLNNSTQYVLYVTHNGTTYGASSQRSSTFTVKSPTATAPTLTANTTVVKGSNVTLNMSATPVAPANSIAKYVVVINGGTAINVNATSNAASYTFATSGSAAAGFAYVMEAYAVDNTGNITTTRSLTATVSITNAPSVTFPAANATGVSTSPTFTLGAYSTTGGSDTHESTTWTLVSSGGTVILSGASADTTRKVSYALSANALQPNTQYTLTVKMTGTITGASTNTTRTFTTGAAMAGPTLTGNSSGYIGQAYALSMSATPTSPATSITSFAVSVDGAASTNVTASGNSGTYTWPAVSSANKTAGATTSFTVTFTDNTGATSASTVKSITMASTFVTAPTLSTPTAGATGVSISPTLTTNSFAVTGGTDTHLNTDWIIKDSAGTTTIWSSLANASNKLTITVPAGILNYSTQYTINVIHRGTASGASAVTSRTFTTAARPVAPTFSAGDMNYMQRGASYNMSVSATPAAPDTSVTSFSVVIDGAAAVVYPATSNSALPSILASVGSNKAAGDTISISVTATGNTGSISSAATKTITVRDINTPSIVSPGPGNTLSLTPTITTSAYGANISLDGHIDSVLEISTLANGGGTMVYTKRVQMSVGGTTEANLTSFTIPSGTLSNSTTYHVRVKYMGANWNIYSPYSASVSFSTVAGTGVTWVGRSPTGAGGMLAAEYGTRESGLAVYGIGGYTNIGQWSAGELWFSNDTTSWTKRTIDGAGLITSLIKIPGGNWVAAGYTSTGSDNAGFIATCPHNVSPSATTWTVRTYPAGSVWALAWDGAQVVAAGYDSAASVAAVCTSPDGVTWTNRGKPGTGADGWALGLAYSPSLDRLVVVGYNELNGSGYLSYSADAVTWTSWFTANDALQAVCWSPTLSLFVAVGSGGTTSTGSIYTSPNGLDWTSRTFTGAGELHAVAWTGTQFIAVGYGTSGAPSSGGILTSPNGITWTARSAVNGVGRLRGVNGEGPLAVAVGYSTAGGSTNPGVIVS